MKAMRIIGWLLLGIGVWYGVTDALAYFHVIDPLPDWRAPVGALSVVVGILVLDRRWS